MSTVIETDLKEVLTQINQKLDNLQRDVTDLKIGQARLEAELKGDIKALDAKMDGLGKRLENQKFVSRGVLIALICAILGSFAKLFGFVGNS